MRASTHASNGARQSRADDPSRRRGTRRRIDRAPAPAVTRPSATCSAPSPRGSSTTPGGQYSWSHPREPQLIASARPDTPCTRSSGRDQPRTRKCPPSTRDRHKKPESIPCWRHRADRAAYGERDPPRPVVHWTPASTNRRPRQRQARGAHRLLLRGCPRPERQRLPRGCVGDEPAVSPRPGGGWWRSNFGSDVVGVVAAVDADALAPRAWKHGGRGRRAFPRGLEERSWHRWDARGIVNEGLRSFAGLDVDAYVGLERRLLR